MSFAELKRHIGSFDPHADPADILPKVHGGETRAVLTR